MLFALAAGNTFLGVDGTQTTSLVANNAKAMLFTQSGKPTFKEGVNFGGNSTFPIPLASSIPYPTKKSRRGQYHF